MANVISHTPPVLWTSHAFFDLLRRGNTYALIIGLPVTVNRVDDLPVRFDRTGSAVIFLIPDKIQHRLYFPCCNLRIPGELFIENAVPALCDVKFPDPDQRAFNPPSCGMIRFYIPDSF